MKRHNLVIIATAAMPMAALLSVAFATAAPSSIRVHHSHIQAASFTGNAVAVPYLTSDDKYPGIPHVFDADAESMELPLADASATPVHIPAEYYYKIPIIKLYQSYPIYSPDRNPDHYEDHLRTLEPRAIEFDPSKFKTDADWIKAGELIFNAPIRYNNTTATWHIGQPAWWKEVAPPVDKNGVMPFNRYVIRNKGFLEVGNLSCASCHIRVMPDGTCINGAQGNFPVDRALAYKFKTEVNWGIPPMPGVRKDVTGASSRLGEYRAFDRFLAKAPWISPDPGADVDNMSIDQVVAAHRAIPGGVVARHGASLVDPVQVPDLIGVKNRKFLDRTGLVRQRSIGDMMRYAAYNQTADVLATFHGNFIPLLEFTTDMPAPTDFQIGERYSDPMLYALSKYIYSLKPPRNPNPTRTSLVRRGRDIFKSEGCVSCHTPPLYTNNKLTPVDGYSVPAAEVAAYSSQAWSIGTDPGLSLRTRRGTGFYKVPSLLGVWYRGPFEHSGSVATLDDWFNPNRVKSDYIPTGFLPPGVAHRAVPGHPFGLELSPNDRKALVAFLKTL